MRPIPRHVSAPEPWRFRGPRLARSVVDALRTRYPRYLFGLPPATDEVPVFHFHDVEADTFARQLEYLRTNGYRTRFMDWEQLRECVASGLVDVASHGHRHALVFDSGRLAGFATARLLERYDIYDWPMRHDDAGHALGRPPLGTPIYGAAPLLSAHTRYLESAALREACTSLVARSGGAEFFSRPDCHARLLSLHRSPAASLPGRFAGGPPCAHGRIRGDWLELLPGSNRARLLPAVARKVAASAGQQHLAH